MATQTLRTRPWSPGFRSSAKSVPSIPLNMTQMGSCGDLSVRGVSTPVLRREKTISFVEKGRADTVSKENKFYMNGYSSPRLLHWPLDYQQHPQRQVRQKTSPNFRGKSEDELYDKVRDKLTTGFYGLRHMFKANDPMGKGNVTREALLRILYNLCGYITNEQFNRFLERLDLESNNLISFTDFVKCFQDNETIKRQWVIPTHKLETQELRRAMYPEEKLRNLDNMEVYPYHSAPYVAAFLRDKLQTGGANIRDILPRACFDTNGMILAPQLREALAQLDVHLTDTEYDKFWSRFDRDNCGAVFTKQFYKQVGLTVLGQPKITSTAITTSNSHKNTASQRQKSEIVTCWSTEEKDGVRRDTLRTSYNYDVEDENLDETEETKVRHQRTNDAKGRKTSSKQSVKSNKPPVPPSTQASSVKVIKHNKTSQQIVTRFENVLDSLYSKYEEPYNFMFEAFQIFDFLDDGYISKVDFRRVLKEFGLPIAALELDEFLKSCCFRTIKGQINYKDFLKKYQSRKTLRTLTDGDNKNQIIREETKTEVKNTSKSERLESKVVEHLHGDFINLVTELREADTTNEGTVSEDTFRSLIEKQLGGGLTDKQWTLLQKDVGTKNGSVPYPGFLAKFDIQPGTWNQQQHGETILPKHNTVHRTPDPTVEKLRHMASYMMTVKDKEVDDEKNKLIQETSRQIEDVLRNRFHTFDKNFKEMDRKMTGRMTKWQFGALLRLTGLILEQRELDQLWSSLKLAPDGMLAYCALVQQFNPSSKIKTAWGTAPSVDENTQTMVEKAKQIQKERREALLARPRSAPNANRRPDSAKNTLHLRTDAATLLKRKEIMMKIQPNVVKNWDRLHQCFVNLDRQGYSNIGYMEMKGVMAQLQLGLTNTEMTEILDQFDLQGNGRFHYIAFLEAFGPHRANFESVGDLNEMSPTFVSKQPSDVCKTKECFTIPSAVNTLRNKLLREWQNLRRAFRKMDSNSDGYLEAGDFKKCLQVCNVDGSDEDLYLLFSEFDKNLTGKIAYKEFLKTLLSVK